MLEKLKQRTRSNFNTRDMAVVVALFPQVDLSVVSDEMQQRIQDDLAAIGVPIVQHKKPTLPTSLIDSQIRLQFGRVLSGRVRETVLRHAPTATTFRRFWEAASVEAPFISIIMLALTAVAVSEACVERGFSTLEATITDARNQLSDERVKALTFLANRPVDIEGPNLQEEQFTLDQEDAEALLDLLCEAAKTRTIKRARTELRRGNVVSVKFFNGGKTFVSLCRLVRIDKSCENSWIVDWVKISNGIIEVTHANKQWNMQLDYEWWPVE